MFDAFFNAIAALLAWFYELPLVGGSIGMGVDADGRLLLAGLEGGTFSVARGHVESVDGVRWGADEGTP